MAALWWIRLDLRLADNPALIAALELGGPVVPVFIWAPEEEGAWAPGGASKWWLHRSLDALDTALREAGSRLILREGSSLQTLRELAKETGAKAVFWNRRYEPEVTARDGKIKEALRADGLSAKSFNAALWHEPWEIKNNSGKPFQVFTPYWKHCLAREEPPVPLPSPRELRPPKKWPASLALGKLKLEPTIPWDKGLREEWTPGEDGANQRLRKFITQAYVSYSDSRNRPDQAGTSKLSPHLHFGEISPRQIWHQLATAAPKHGWARWKSSQFLAEIGWREFAHHLLFHFPHTPTQPLRDNFKNFPWSKNAQHLHAWQTGLTGYPIVDAGLRELWATGWMHNRVRMIVASFLVKDLLLPWEDGARWFWDTLVDADLAQNTMGWQWTAGCGADAAPYFRVFNPTSQGEKFDPEGGYVRQWCPELARLPKKWLHRPHEAPAEVLASAGVVLGNTYPEPIVRHSIARELALQAYQRIRKTDTA